MSSTLLAMKEIMERNGMLNMPNNEAKNKEKGEEIDNKQIPSSLSETTVYQNALQRHIQMNSVPSRLSEINKNLRETDTREVQVDSEINFRVCTEQPDKNNRFSLSSDELEQVDTSDEMLELDNMDINDRFIADCAREAVAAAAISGPNVVKKSST